MQEETNTISKEEELKQKQQQEEVIAKANEAIKDAKNNISLQVQRNININPEFAKQAAVMESLQKQELAKSQGRRAEIQLYEFDWGEQDPEAPGAKPKLKPINGGRGEYHPVIVTFKTPADIVSLQKQYARCEQTFKIVRWLDPIPEQQNDPQQQVSVQQQQTQQNININQSQQSNVQIQKSKPKYYKIGNVEIKEDNGKIYQKQWIRLSDIESANFRIVNDKTNSLVNLKGKSIEMKKWVLVEKNENETTDLEENLNG